MANDSVRSRCSMLLRRCAALGECAKVLMVVTHKAQCLPPLPATFGRTEGTAGSGTANVKSSSLESYDRIVCDVPCSGDGTTRKNPSVWHRWSQASAALLARPPGVRRPLDLALFLACTRRDPMRHECIELPCRRCRAARITQKLRSRLERLSCFGRNHCSHRSD